MNPQLPGVGENRREVLLALSWGWLIFGLVFFSFCFQPGILRSDDFGYLRSVLGTLHLGHPYAYEWLAPFGIVFSSTCALLFHLSGNFFASTYGFQAFCVLAFFPLLYGLLVRRMRPHTASILTLTVATFPLFLAKEADFHGGICTLDLFLVSLLCFETGKFGGFFVAAFLAFANRQNQICLLLLPLWLVVKEYLIDRRISTGLVVGGTCYGLLVTASVVFMNRTYASLHATFEVSGWMGMVGNGIVALLAGGIVTLGFLAILSISKKSSLEVSEPRKRWLKPLCASVVLLALIPFWHGELIKIDTPTFGVFGWPQVNLILPWLILPCLWMLDFRLLKPSPYLALIAAYILMASLRGVWWDYYFMEIMVLGLLLNSQVPENSLRAAMSMPSESAPRASPHVDSGAHPDLLRISVGGWVFVLLTLLGNIGYGYFLKVSLDKQMLAVKVMEEWERKGALTVDRMTGATFGYLGWKLFDYFLANEGKTYGNLADFVGYVKRDRVVIDTYLPWRRSFKSPLPATAELLDSGICSIGFVTLPYRIADLHGPASQQSVSGRPMSLDSARFRSPRYPLNNREWKDFIDSTMGR